MKKPRQCIMTVIKHSGHLRTLKKCKKHMSAAPVCYIFIVLKSPLCFNLSQCNTQLMLQINLRICKKKKKRIPDCPHKE